MAMGFSGWSDKLESDGWRICVTGAAQCKSHSVKSHHSNRIKPNQWIPQNTFKPVNSRIKTEDVTLFKLFSNMVPRGNEAISMFFIDGDIRNRPIRAMWYNSALVIALFTDIFVRYQN